MASNVARFYEGLRRLRSRIGDSVKWEMLLSLPTFSDSFRLSLTLCDWSQQSESVHVIRTRATTV